MNFSFSSLVFPNSYANTELAYSTGFPSASNSTSCPSSGFSSSEGSAAAASGASSRALSLEPIPAVDSVLSWLSYEIYASSLPT